MPAVSRKHSVQPPSTLADLDPLIAIIPTIFNQVQSSVSNHKKNIVALRKIQEACSVVTQHAASTSNDGTLKLKLVGEKVFHHAFIEMVNRVVAVKKGVSVADRVVQFVGKFVAYTIEQGALTSALVDINKEAQDDNDDNDDEPEESFSTRFANRLLKHLLAGCQAKDKTIRYRVVQLIVVLLNSFDEIEYVFLPFSFPPCYPILPPNRVKLADPGSHPTPRARSDDLYATLRSSLLERARDKEVPVRIQATLGLARLRAGDDPDDEREDDEEEDLGQVLLDMLRFDSAPEVRRAALYSLPLSPSTIPHIIARTRDLDPTLRRITYLGPLSTGSQSGTHSSAAGAGAGIPDPRVLAINQREEVVRNGLGDREPQVRRAAAGMLGGWLEAAGGDLLEDEARLERVLPVVTAMAFKLQEEYNLLEETTPAEELDSQQQEEDGEDLPAEYVERTFVVAELCKMAVNLDYSDEIGRRKMFQLAREMISQRTLPSTIMPLCLDILYKISDSERDLIRVIVDVVTELRVGPSDERDQDDTMSVADSIRYQRRNSVATTTTNVGESPQEAMMAVLIDSRCLAICISLLERVNGTLQENSVFHGLLPDLIIPAVKNKYEPYLRMQGLICLGLCSMIDSNMAKNSIGLFMQQISQAEDDDKVKVAKIVFDLFMVHDPFKLLTGVMSEDQIVGFLAHMLQQDLPEVQAVACEGLAKLMLSGMLFDSTLLQNLILLYLTPETADNLPLRQCLSYFFPVYCYSLHWFTLAVLQVVVDTLELLAEANEDVSSEHHIPLSQAALLLVDWTDPEKIAEQGDSNSNSDVHLDLAIEVARAAYRHEDKDYRKLLVSMLGKLRLPDTPHKNHKVQELAITLRYLVSRHPMGDAASRNALTRFDNNLRKKYSEILADLDEEELRINEQLKPLWDFIDDSDGEDGQTRGAAATERDVSSTPQSRPRSKLTPAPAARSRNGKPAESEGEQTDAGTEVEVDDDAQSVDSMLDGDDDDDDDDSDLLDD
ncbi:hypothetical protein QFC24_006346 [Naganishia onofrii]|uniref:Uncharacterized protein n=1 Tax=Naganishia onofrii TaxID=1851511 RepID=A0ACC2X1Z7_9TREE|nr:hypothetical protein QFC24_006346 [Naganishia onofrii]